MLRTVERISFDTQKELPKNGEIIELAKRRAAKDHAFRSLEQRCGPYEERITTGRLQDLEFDSLVNESKSDILVNLATYRVWQWHWDNKQKAPYLLWISPPDPEVGFTEPRFTVYWEEKNGTHFKAFIGPQNDSECLEIANNLFQEKFTSIDKLRCTPIEFTPPLGVSWINYLKEQIILPKGMWKKMESGEDIALQNKALKDSQEIMENYYPLILKAKTRGEYIYIGYLIEKEAEKRGWKIVSRGSCDLTNTAFLQSLQVEIKDVSINKVVNFQDYLNKKRYEYTKKDICRMCEKEKWVCPPPQGCNVCQECTEKDSLKSFQIAA